MARTASKKPQIVDVEAILNNEVDRTKLMNMIDEAVRCEIKAKDQKDSIKAIKDEALEQLGCDPKIFSGLVKAAFKNNAAEELNKMDALRAALELLTPKD